MKIFFWYEGNDVPLGIVPLSADEETILPDNRWPAMTDSDFVYLRHCVRERVSVETLKFSSPVGILECIKQEFTSCDSPFLGVEARGASYVIERSD